MSVLGIEHKPKDTVRTKEGGKVTLLHAFGMIRGWLYLAYDSDIGAGQRARWLALSASDLSEYCMKILAGIFKLERQLPALTLDFDPDATVNSHFVWPVKRTCVHIVPSPSSINIAIQGYSNYYAPDDAAPEYYSVVDIDLAAPGEPQVLVWADINDQAPTHVISLENAREDKRNDD